MYMYVYILQEEMNSLAYHRSPYIRGQNHGCLERRMRKQ